MSQDAAFGGTDTTNGDPDPTTVTASGDEYSTQGRTTVRAPWGQAFRSADASLPLIDERGVLMTKEQAEAVVAEAEDNNLTLTIDKDGE